MFDRLLTEFQLSWNWSGENRPRNFLESKVKSGSSDHYADKVPLPSYGSKSIPFIGFQSENCFK